MDMVIIILVIALVSFVAAALGISSRVNLIAVGLALLTLVQLLDR
jgi:hypothetical protein